LHIVSKCAGNIIHVFVHTLKSLFTLCAEFHVARMQTKFWRNCPHHIKGCAGLF